MKRNRVNTRLQQQQQQQQQYGVAENTCVVQTKRSHRTRMLNVLRSFFTVWNTPIDVLSNVRRSYTNHKQIRYGAFYAWYAENGTISTRRHDAQSVVYASLACRLSRPYWLVYSGDFSNAGHSETESPGARFLSLTPTGCLAASAVRSVFSVSRQNDITLFTARARHAEIIYNFRETRSRSIQRPCRYLARTRALRRRTASVL